VIDKDYFTEKQWEESFLSISFSEYFRIYEKLKDQCKKDLTEDDCEVTYFEDNKRAVKIPDVSKKRMQVDLYYDVIMTIEEEPSWYKLILDTVNIQSILFNLNLFQFLNILLYFITSQFELKNTKYCQLLIYFLCTIGLFIHIGFIFSFIINEELIQSQSYELTNSLKMPEIIFCFNFDQSLIDKNVKLNGEYLEKLTKDMQTESIFEKIRYLNKTNNNWIELESPNFTNSIFDIDTFYFSNKKCFKIKQQIEYDRNQFFFNDENEVLKIHFNSSFIKLPANEFVYFFTKKPGTLHFSKINNLNYQKWSYSIHQELFDVQYEGSIF
jgi:hypothetical protein